MFYKCYLFIISDYKTIVEPKCFNQLFSYFTENLQNNDDAFGFSVGLDHHVILDGDKVKYNVTITNVTSSIGSGGYDPNTGDFTAPRTGLYIFHFHSLARSGQVSTCSSIVNVFIFTMY